MGDLPTWAPMMVARLESLEKEAGRVERALFEMSMVLRLASLPRLSGREFMKFSFNCMWWVGVGGGEWGVGGGEWGVGGGEWCVVGVGGDGEWCVVGVGKSGGW